MKWRQSVVLMSVLLLTACSNSEPKSISNLQSNTTQSIKRSTKSSSFEKVSSPSSTQSSSATPSTPHPPLPQKDAGNSEQQTPVPSAPPTTSSMNLQAIVNGDYSSVAGTWQNGRGQQLVFDKNGLVSEIRQVEETYLQLMLSQLSVENGALTATMSHFDLQGNPFGRGGLILVMLPAGVPSSYYQETSPRDRVMVGQSVGMERDPEVFYKVMS